MLHACVVKSGTSVEAVVPDDKGLGRLEALIRPWARHPHILHKIYHPDFFSLCILVLRIDYLERGRRGV